MRVFVKLAALTVICFYKEVVLFILPYRNPSFYAVLEMSVLLTNAVQKSYGPLKLGNTIQTLGIP